MAVTIIDPGPNLDSKTDSACFLTAFVEAGSFPIMAATQASGSLIHAINGLGAAIPLVEQEKARFTLKNPIL
ncbi:MAG: hypothetical protein WA821_02895 [Anaerolineales bacterium]